jgi:Ni,Fe-hydrogenase III large subunit/Ni,Fe-hydrogenase III component G
MEGREHYIEVLTGSLGDRLTVRPGKARNEIYLELQPGWLRALPEICLLLAKSFHAQFTTIVANDDRPQHGNVALYYVFSVPTADMFLLLEVPVDPRHMEVPSISHFLESANWFEREVKDWFGIIAFPNITTLAVHPDWPQDVHPMLKEVDARATVPRVRGTFEFKHVEGEGIFEIPVGPVHAGIIEPGHFRFSVAGEPIINLDLQLFYTHKGTEKIAEGMPVHRAVYLAERVSGDSSFAHAVALCHAVERLSAVDVPARALVVRTMMLELERLYNHVGDVGGILLDVGFAVGAARASEIKERFLRLNETLTGSRLLRGVAAPGGITREPERNEAGRTLLRQVLRESRTSFDDLVDLVMSSSSVIDRLETTGKLEHADAHRLGVTGIAGRASGINRDFRRDHPHCAYAPLKIPVAIYEQGDVLARMMVRIDEVRTALSLVEELIGKNLHESIRASGFSPAPGEAALGYVEGWRGEIVHWLKTDDDGRVYRWKITDPSFHNWRGLQAAVRNNIVPDFPVINKSFNLSYSGNDR